ncbi:hypothetical protein ACFFX0_16865 [Citricoccus parietis]|uniref:Uncharacterized protein n=1 Tax=Citricoccus parietis TaxID=592307 RepID=A0ABV5G1G8_9MICC
MPASGVSTWCPIAPRSTSANSCGPGSPPSDLARSTAIRATRNPQPVTTTLPTGLPDSTAATASAASSNG